MRQASTLQSQSPRASSVRSISSDASSQFSSTTFLVYVGRSKKEYHLHKTVLIEKCPYFKRMLTSKFSSKEQLQNSVCLRLKVDQEDAFDEVVRFFYTGTYSPPRGFDSDTLAQLHARVYVLAERLGMLVLKDEALAHMVKTLEHNNSYGYEGRHSYTQSKVTQYLWLQPC